MAVVSKLFKEALQSGQCCNDLVHPGSCTMNAILNTYKFLWSNATYFAPVIFLPLVMKIRKLNTDVLKSTLHYYAMSVVHGTFIGWTVSIMICVFRHLFGEFKFYSFLFLPSVIGAMGLFVARSTRTEHLFKTSVFQCTIEAVILARKNFITRALANSVPLRTLIFMCCSAFILHSARNKTFRGFWFLTAAPKTAAPLQNEETPMNRSSTCSHAEKSCMRYILHGVRNYLAIGLALDGIKMLMSKAATDKKGFVEKLLAKCKNYKLQSGAFLAYYMAVYRLVHCYLNQRAGADLEWNHMVAGFLAGSCYPLYSKITLFSYALLLSIQTYWKQFKLRKSKSDNAFFALAKRLNFENILYPVSMGYLVHTYCFRRRYVSNLGEVIVNGVTNNYARRINKRIEDIEKDMDARMRSIS